MKGKNKNMERNRKELGIKIKKVLIASGISLIATLIIFSFANYVSYNILTPFFSFDDKQTNCGFGCSEDYCICANREDCSYQKTVYVCMFFFSMLSLMLMSYFWIDERF